MRAFIAGLAVVLTPWSRRSTPRRKTPMRSFTAIYTAEWKWREDQFGDEDGKSIVDHLPKVDAATQEMRLHIGKTC